jgi:hypothetical protein
MVTAVQPTSSLSMLSTGPALSSCRPLLSLLDESDQSLKQFALQKLVPPRAEPAVPHRPIPAVACPSPSFITKNFL